MKNIIYPATGTITFSWSKSLWFYAMLIPIFFIDFTAISIEIILCNILLLFLTVSIGHSVGLHRGVIHKAYDTSPAVKNSLVYLFVLSGLGSPITWLKLHYYRDYWQNRTDCPPYFAYEHSIFTDFWWYLHLSFKTSDNERYEIPEVDLNNKWFQWLHKTWYWHHLVLAIVLYALTDLNTTLFLMCFRIAMALIGHWYIGYAAHKYGYARFEVANAKESGYNDAVLGLLSFGEGFHNNHHGHPSSAKFSHAWYEIDLSWYVILLLEKVNLVRNVKRPIQNRTLKLTAKHLGRIFRKWPG